VSLSRVGGWFAALWPPSLVVLAQQNPPPGSLLRRWTRLRLRA